MGGVSINSYPAFLSSYCLTSILYTLLLIRYSDVLTVCTLNSEFYLIFI